VSATGGVDTAAPDPGAAVLFRGESNVDGGPLDARAIAALYAQHMQVRVLLFGVLKERMGGSERTVHLSADARVADLVAWVRVVLNDDGLVRSLAVAVNQEYAGNETPLHEGDEVALLPPVSGGSRRDAV